MRPRLLVCALVLAALGPAARADDEDPGTYGGRPASWWVGELAKPETLPIARAALVHIGAPALPALVEALGDATFDAPTRGRIAALVAEIPGDVTPHVGALVAALEDGRPGQTASLLTALARAGPAARVVLPGLPRLATRRDTDVRRGVAAVLGAVGPPLADALPLLAVLVADRETSVRQGAYRAIGEIGSAEPAGLEILALGLRDTQPAVRIAAARALARLPLDAPGVAEALRDAAASPHPEVRAAGIAQVARDVLERGNDAALEVLVAAIDDAHPDVRKAALEGAALVPAQAAVLVPVVLAHVRDVDLGVRVAAVRTLGRLGGAAPEAVDALLAARAEPALKDVASEVLRRLRPAVTPRLLAYVVDEAAAGHSDALDLLASPSDDEVALALHLFTHRLRDPGHPPDGRLALVRWMGRRDVLRPACVAPCCEALRRPTPAVEKAVTDVLGRLARDNDLDALFAGLATSPEAHERRAALLVFSKRPLTVTRLRVLDGLLDDPVRDHRVRAALATTGLFGNNAPATTPHVASYVAREKVVAALEEGLAPGNEAWIRRLCIGGLTQHLPRSASAAPKMTPFLEGEDPQAFELAVAFLARAGTPEARAALGRALVDPDPHKRLLAAETLAPLDHAGVRVLEASLDHEDPRVREAALDAFHHLAGRRVHPKGRALKRVADLLGDEDVRVSRAAIRLLQVMPLDERLYTAVSRAAVDNALSGMTRHQLVFVLMRFRDRSAPLLAELLTDPDVRIQSAAVTGLGRLGRAARDAVPALERLAAGPNIGLSALARAALQAIEDDTPGR